MKTMKQISVIIENVPGTLARICNALREEGINVNGFAAWGESDHGIVRIVCDRPLKALDLLESAGMIAVAREVLQVTCKNQPGALFDVAEVLEKAGVNIDYAYGSTAEAEEGAMFLAVSDLAAARKYLKPGGSEH